METVKSAPTIHFFDVHVRRIACGLHGFEHRSTKHARNVTCEACIALIGTRPVEDEAPNRYEPVGEGASL